MALMLKGATVGLVEECWNRVLPATPLKNFPGKIGALNVLFFRWLVKM